MLRRFTKWSLLLVAVMSFSIILAACGDNTATPSTGGTQTQGGAPTAPAGVKSAMAASFPDTTTVYLTLNTDISTDQIKGWQKIVDYLSNIPEIKSVASQADVLKLTGLGSYDTDIKPWIGSELAFGVTDVNAILNLTSGTSAAGSELPVLLGAPVKDQAKAQEFLTKVGNLLKTAGLPAATEETYKDAKLSTYNLGIASLVAGLSKDKLFIGGGPAIVKAAFDRTADKSLSSSITYKAVASKLPTGNLAYVYMDYQGLIKALTSNPQLKQMMGNSLSGLDYTAGVGLTMGTADEGFRIDAYQTYMSDKMPTAVSDKIKKGNNPNKILNALPESTVFFANMRDAASSYDTFVSALKSAGGTSGVDTDKGLADFEKETGLSVKNDIVGLFGGEFSLFVSGDAANKSFPVGLGLLADATDKAATQTKLDKIGAAIEKSANGQLKWESKTNGSTTYKSATIEQGTTKTTANLGITGSYAFFTVGDAATTGVITAAGGGKNFTNGANAASFNKVKGVLPGSNSGYVYLDIQATLGLVNSAAPAEMATQLKAYTDKLTKLYSVGASSTETLNDATSTIFIYFPVTK